MKSLSILFLLFSATAALSASPQTPTQISPSPVTGQGTQSVTSSALINTANVTVTGASSSFPATQLPSGMLTIKVQGGQTQSVAICWLGGTCTFAAGEVVQPGETVTKNLSNTFATKPPTVIAQSGTVTIAVEW